MGAAIMKGILKNKIDSDVKLYALINLNKPLEKAVEAGVFKASKMQLKWLPARQICILRDKAAAA